MPRVLLVGLSTTEGWEGLTPICVLTEENCREIYKKATIAIRMARRWNMMVKGCMSQVVFTTWFHVAPCKFVRNGLLGDRFEDVQFGDVPEDASEFEEDIACWTEQPEESRIEEGEKLQAYLAAHATEDEAVNMSVEGIQVYVDPQAKHPDEYSVSWGVDFHHHDDRLFPTYRVELRQLRDCAGLT